MLLKKILMRHNSSARVYLRPTTTILVFSTQPTELSASVIQRDLKRATGRDIDLVSIDKWLKYKDDQGRKNVKKVPDSTWDKGSSAGEYLWNILHAPEVAERVASMNVIVDNGPGPRDFYKIT